MKSKFATNSVEYLRFKICRYSTSPPPNKVEDILERITPVSAHTMQQIQSMVQYCLDLWQEHKKILVPIIDLVQEAGTTKVQKWLK